MQFLPNYFLATIFCIISHLSIFLADKQQQDFPKIKASAKASIWYIFLAHYQYLSLIFYKISNFFWVAPRLERKSFFQWQKRWRKRLGSGRQALKNIIYQLFSGRFPYLYHLFRLNKSPPHRLFWKFFFSNLQSKELSKAE